MHSTPALHSIDWTTITQRLVKQLKVTDAQLWHVRLQCYCACGRFDLVKALAGEKKSPIGYKPFALACMRCGPTHIYLPTVYSE